MPRPNAEHIRQKSMPYPLAISQARLLALAPANRGSTNPTWESLFRGAVERYCRIADTDARKAENLNEADHWCYEAVQACWYSHSMQMTTASMFLRACTLQVANRDESKKMLLNTISSLDACCNDGFKDLAPDAIAMLAEMYFDEQCYERAIAVCQTWLNKGQNLPQFHFQLARGYSGIRDFEAAVSEYEAVLQFCETQKDVDTLRLEFNTRFNLGILRHTTAELDLAESQFRRCKEIANIDNFNLPVEDASRLNHALSEVLLDQDRFFEVRRLNEEKTLIDGVKNSLKLPPQVKELHSEKMDQNRTLRTLFSSDSDIAG